MVLISIMNVNLLKLVILIVIGLCLIDSFVSAARPVGRRKGGMKWKNRRQKQGHGLGPGQVEQTTATAGPNDVHGDGNIDGNGQAGLQGVEGSKWKNKLQRFRPGQAGNKTRKGWMRKKNGKGGRPKGRKFGNGRIGGGIGAVIDQINETAQDVLGEVSAATNGMLQLLQVAQNEHSCNCSTETCSDPPTVEVDGKLVCDFYEDTGCMVCSRLTSSSALRCCTYPHLVEKLMTQDGGSSSSDEDHHGRGCKPCTIHRQDGNNSTINKIVLKNGLGGEECPLYENYQTSGKREQFRNEDCEIHVKTAASACKGSGVDVDTDGDAAGDDNQGGVKDADGLNDITNAGTNVE